MTTPTPPIPDWFILRALLLGRIDELDADQADHGRLTLHRWLLIQQGWAVGPCVMSPGTGLPISAAIEGITLDGCDWSTLLENKDALTRALENLASHKLLPSTWLLREMLLSQQLSALTGIVDVITGDRREDEHDASVIAERRHDKRIPLEQALAISGVSRDKTRKRKS